MSLKGRRFDSHSYTICVECSINEASVEPKEASKKLELANAQHLFSAISQHLATLDELETCTTRMRLRFPGETVSPEDAKWKLLPIEVVPELQRMKLERAVADTELASAKNQLRFLLNVQETIVFPRLVIVGQAACQDMLKSSSTSTLKVFNKKMLTKK